MSIALGINVYNDAIALRGLLESGQHFFDNIFVIHSGPGGKRSEDGTIELLEQYGIAPVFADIGKGFGNIRTRLIHECGCDWCFILDADERFHPLLPVMHCFGTDRYPNPPAPNLRVSREAEVINQGAHVKQQIQRADLMAMRATRRHWFDFSFSKPAENWEIIWDHQLRLVRNSPSIHYTQGMHERLVDDRTGKTPFFLDQDPIGGPFIDHYHLFFRKARPGHKEGNEEYYRDHLESIK